MEKPPTGEILDCVSAKLCMKAFIHKLLIILPFGLPFSVHAQTVLEADGPGNTYELINSVLAPGYNVVENPECIHPEFGRHIAEVWDAELNRYVFEFYIHVTPDNDRCINLDRQRVEIKTYDSSPDNLVGVTGETIVYKWKFRIPVGFQPSTSFTHIHQIKAVGGDDADPIFTLTVRQATPNRIELIHNNTTKVTTATLSSFEGVWVEAVERVKIDNLHGTYSITIKRVSDGATLLSYTNNDLMTIRSDNSFIRPKWGIYRSLKVQAALRDESMRFAGFSIAEESPNALGSSKVDERIFDVFPNQRTKEVRINYTLAEESRVKADIIDMNGQNKQLLINDEHKREGCYTESFDVSSLTDGFYFFRMTAGSHTDTDKLIIQK